MTTPSPTVGIAAWGTYLPAYRLDRAAIGAALGQPAGKGRRVVAAYDEDAVSLGVEAGRMAVRNIDTAKVARLFFSTTAPAYLDKTNATTIHAALGLDSATAAFDMVGAVRSGTGALLAAAGSATGGRYAMAVLGDVRTGLPGSSDERSGGDGGAAFVLATDGPVAATILGTAARSAEFLDRWRTPGDSYSKVWEERFGEHVYVPLAQAALEEAVKEAGLDLSAIDHLVVCGTHDRAARRVAAASGVDGAAVLDDLTAMIGHCGAAHVGLATAAALEKAAPGEVIAVVALGDGADALVLRTTDQVAELRPARSVASQAAEGMPVDYNAFLTWRGLLLREPPRRPEPLRPAAPPSFRSDAWKFGFTGTKCVECGTVHLPPARICGECRAEDRMEQVRLADVPATIATYTVDHLAFSMAPPVVTAVIDFDGGGRRQCEVTEVDPAQVAIGGRVELTFRRLYTADGVANYHWKARPARVTTED